MSERARAGRSEREQQLQPTRHLGIVTKLLFSFAFLSMALAHVETPPTSNGISDEDTGQ